MSIDAIRESIRKATSYLREHPSEARYTDSVATATLDEGLRVKVEGASGEQIATDMPPSVGGNGSAPSPGWLFRAALASCDATLIAMRAAAQGIQLSRLEVDALLATEIRLWSDVAARLDPRLQRSGLEIHEDEA